MEFSEGMPETDQLPDLCDIAFPQLTADTRSGMMGEPERARGAIATPHSGRARRQKFCTPLYSVVKRTSPG
jgi:hypothetical protein